MDRKTLAIGIFCVKCARDNLSVLYGFDGIVSLAAKRELATKMYNTGDYFGFLRGDKYTSVSRAVFSFYLNCI